MTYQRQRLINELIATAIKEEIRSIGFALPETIPVLKQVQSSLIDAGKRITYDLGRSRRLVELCKLKRVK